jgi:hypothetical protein
VTEDTPQQDTAPGAGAGDAAPTQQIPHIPKPSRKSGGRADNAKKSAATTALAAKTDKGRPREMPKHGGAPVEDDSSTEVEASTEVEEPTTRRGKQLTAADYARTTKSSPDSTAVIPAVSDEPADYSEPVVADTSGRQASLRLNHIEPWSVTRIAFAVSVAMMIVGVVAMTIFWVVLSITGVWGQVNDSITSVLSDDSSTFDITDYLGFWRLVGLTLVLSAINVVLMTALATIGAHLYNLAAQLLGGIEVTFSEDN